MRFWRYAALGLLLIQILVVSVAQVKRPRVANEQSGPPEITKPGEADGERSPALTGEHRPLYRLQQSDVIEIGFSFAPEFDQTVPVQPDGRISLKEVGEVLAEGKTLPEIRELIQNAYQDVLQEPVATVVLKEFDHPFFLALGEIGHPGKYEMRGRLTVTEAVAIAGGFTGQAKHSQVVLFRRESNDLVEARLLDVKRMLRDRELGEDLQLRPGDMVFVPQNQISKIRKYLPMSNLGVYWNPAQF